MPIKAAIDTAQNVIHIESDTISTKSESKDQTSEKATEKASEKFNA
ncbi:translation initiation factor IF-3 [Rhodobacteraceae bacterium HTCC2150]|nr:translation initiation factor IF-3 [Rhodobacteraceae bacterium HTCC2150]